MNISEGFAEDWSDPIRLVSTVEQMAKEFLRFLWSILRGGTEVEYSKYRAHDMSHKNPGGGEPTAEEYTGVSSAPFPTL